MLEQSAYWLTQNARIGWFLGQYLLARRLIVAPDRRRQSARRQPTIADLVADVRALLRRDWENVRAGIYRNPGAFGDGPARHLAGAIGYFRDLPRVAERSRRNGFDDLLADPPAELRAYPSYYLRNFHYQTDGYLSRHSARLYDQQVEVLFFGSADAMRRQALPPLAAFLRGRRIAATRLVDMGCGTGRFLETVKDTYPRMPVVALDLSPHYLEQARNRLRRWSRVQVVQGLAEAMPIADGGADVATCVYLLHEVPGETRRRIAAEVARVLAPGGRLIVVDSIQLGDRPDYDDMLQGFPKSFHEPFYAEYVAADLAALFAAAGLRLAGQERAFLSKVMVFDKQ
jgi:ubiquinone/menaquinone biosynthesis C-methylase UbiE